MSRPVATRTLLGLTAVLLVLLISRPPAEGQQDDTVNSSEGEEHGLGLIPDAPSVLRRLPRVPRYRAFLPPSVDLSSALPLPGNQGKLGSCASWAVAYAARSYYTTAYEKRSNRLSSNIPSPLYTWQLARGGSCNAGSSLENVVDVLKHGALSLARYPYRASCSRPSSGQMSSASDFRVLGSRIVDWTSVDDIRGELAKGNPVIFGLPVGGGWALDWKTQGVRKGYLIEGNRGAKGVGSHAMTLIGYDDSRKAFRLINSWGRRWGDGGYAWMSYDFVRNGRLDEAIVLDVDHESPPSPAPPEPEPDPRPAPAPPSPPNPKPIPPIPPRRPVDFKTLQCANVVKETRAGRIRVTGFVQSLSDLEAVKASIDAATTDVDLRVLPFPLCEAAQTLLRPLASSDRPEIDTGGRSSFKAGDTLSFTIRSPQSLRFIYVVYFSRDGDVETLTQPDGFMPRQAPPGKTFVFGDGNEGRQKFTVTAPYGDEMIVALASKSPLFDNALPKSQTEREFLSNLRLQLVYKPNPALPDREVSASLATIRTEGR